MNTKTAISDFTAEEIRNNHEIMIKRNAFYKEYGIDQEQMRRSIIKLVEPHNASILEIGTGKGYLTSMLAALPGRVVTVDPDSSESRIAMINAAYYNRLENIEFVTADACNLSYRDSSFDVVVSAFTFHHLDLPFKVLREMTRIAEKQVIISDFNERGFETIDRLHHSEGRTHERKPSDFTIVGVFLEEFNFDVTVVEEEWQTIYSAKRK